MIGLPSTVAIAIAIALASSALAAPILTGYPGGDPHHNYSCSQLQVEIVGAATLAGAATWHQIAQDAGCPSPVDAQPPTPKDKDPPIPKKPDQCSALSAAWIVAGARATSTSPRSAYMDHIAAEITALKCPGGVPAALWVASCHDLIGQSALLKVYVANPAMASFTESALQQAIHAMDLEASPMECDLDPLGPEW